MTTLRRNTFIALALLLGAGGWGWRQKHELNRHRAELAALETALAEAQRQQAEAGQPLEELRQALASECLQRDAALAAEARRSRAPGGLPAETRWTQPPPAWPSWEAGSPYVWLRKEALARLGVQAFTKNGLLTAELGTLLEIEPSARAAISERARRLLTEWRTSEAERATGSDQHLPNIGDGPGPIVTVIVPPQPELAARLRQEFNATVRETLGEQRAKLLAGFAEDGLVAELSSETSPAESVIKPKTFTVRRAGNMFQIAIQSGGGSSSMFTHDWRSTVPAHLQTLFAETFGDQEGR